MFKQSPSKKFWICQLNWIISNEMGIKICYPFLGSIIAFEYFVCCQPDCYCLSICQSFFLLLPFWEEFVSKFNRNVLLNFGIIYKFFFWNYYCSRWFVYSSLNYRVVFSVFFIVGGFCSILTIDWLIVYWWWCIRITSEMNTSTHLLTSVIFFGGRHKYCDKRVTTQYQNGNSI